MERAFNYMAKNSKGKIIKGLIFSPNKALGLAKLKRNGLLPTFIKENFSSSIRYAFKREFDQKDLSRFYSTLGRRINNNKSMPEGLEAAVEFVKDEKLRQSILMMRQSLLDGQNEHQAMVAGGFPSRDCLVIKATMQAGQIGDSFISMSKEIERIRTLRAQVKSTFRMPMIMAAIMYVFLYIAIVKVAPETMKFLTGTHLKMKLNPMNEAYFAFARYFNSNIEVASAIYWTIPILLIKASGSAALKKLVDMIPLVKALSQKSDQAALWTSFAMLYNASIPVREVCKVVGDSAKRADSRESFLRMGKSINMGMDLGDALGKSGFPDYVESGIASAYSSGDFMDGIADLTATLEEDVLMLTQFLQDNMKLASIVIVGMGVAGMFFVTYYPIVSSVVSNL